MPVGATVVGAVVVPPADVVVVDELLDVDGGAVTVTAAPVVPPSTADTATLSTVTVSLDTRAYTFFVDCSHVVLDDAATAEFSSWLDVLPEPWITAKSMTSEPMESLRMTTYSGAMPSSAAMSVWMDDTSVARRAVLFRSSAHAAPLRRNVP